MPFDEWVDLSMAGMELKLVRVPQGRMYYIVQDTTKDTREHKGVETHFQALSSMGFRHPTGSVILVLKEAVFDESNKPVQPPQATLFVARIPGAKACAFDEASHYINPANNGPLPTIKERSAPVVPIQPPCDSPEDDALGSPGM